MKSGFIAIVGRPNVGKSTLINQLIGEKVSIISDKAGTTRENIRCIVNKDDKQYIFIDTPGIHKPKNFLGEYMFNEAIDSLKETEVILFMLDASTGIGKNDITVYEAVKESGKHFMILLNKADLVDDETIELRKQEIEEKIPGAVEIIPLASLYNLGVYNLLPKLDKYLTYDYFFYPVDYYTDMPVNKIVVNIVREKILMLTKEEIPHSVAIVIDNIESENDKRTYHMTIYVERDSQKGIIIGKGASMIKKIRQLATLDIMKLTGLKINLHLMCKVSKNWRKNKKFLNDAGYMI